MKTPDADYEPMPEQPALKGLAKITGLFRRKKVAPLEIVDDAQIEKARKEYEKLIAQKENLYKTQSIQTQKYRKPVEQPVVYEQKEQAVQVQQDPDVQAQEPPAPAAPEPMPDLYEPHQTIIRKQHDIQQQKVNEAIEVTTISTKSAKRLSAAINASILGVAFIIGIAGVQVIYTHMPTYPMVSIGIVAVAGAAGVITNMAAR